MTLPGPRLSPLGIDSPCPSATGRAVARPTASVMTGLNLGGPSPRCAPGRWPLALALRPQRPLALDFYVLCFEGISGRRGRSIAADPVMHLFRQRPRAISSEVRRTIRNRHPDRPLMAFEPEARSSP